MIIQDDAQATRIIKNKDAPVVFFGYIWTYLKRLANIDEIT